VPDALERYAEIADALNLHADTNEKKVRARRARAGPCRVVLRGRGAGMGTRAWRERARACWCVHARQRTQHRRMVSSGPHLHVTRRSMLRAAQVIKLIEAIEKLKAEVGARFVSMHTSWRLARCRCCRSCPRPPHGRRAARC
jgi:hypothetical protein